MLLAALLLPVLALAAPSAVSPAGAQSGGSIVIMGIDAEDGGPGGHGPITSYEAIVDAILTNVTNGQSGIAVMGGGAGTNVEAFWNAIATDLGTSVDFYADEAAIAGAPFEDYAMIAVSSSSTETPSGGITDTENDELTLRAFEVVDHVNGGGGLIGFNATGLTEPYGYMGDFGAFENEAGDYSNIEATPEGEALEVDLITGFCCWHDTYTVYPSFLNVLATNADVGSPTEGQVAALGGFDIAIPTGCTLEPAALSIAVGDAYTATATATENNAPAVGIPVVFEVLEGPNAGLTGNATTDANGQGTFSYTSTATGVDTVAAAFTDSLGRVRNCNLVTVEWVPAPTTTTAAVAPVTPVARPARLTPAFTG